MSLPSIQEKLDGLDPGGTLAMERGDYGPCVINKPVILICDGATFWTDGNVPAVTVQSSGVVIKDAKMRGLDTASHVVISAAKDSHPLLQNIHIFGKAVGVEPEPAEWIVPEGIHTGEIPANHPGFFVDLAVPQRSQIVCRISGVSMDPSALSPGINTVKLQISDALPDSILIGEIEVIGSVLTRLIPFFARITASPSPKSSGDTSPLIEISAQEKERFQKGIAGSTPASSQPSSTQKSPAAPQTGKQKTQSVPAVEPPKKQPARVSKPADKTQANPGKRKSTPAAQEDPLKLGGAFGSGETIKLRKLPVYILADCSSGMDGVPIALVKNGISALHADLMNDPSSIESVWMSLITFDSEARQVIPLTELFEFKAPELPTTDGRALGSALKLLSGSIGREVSKGSNQQKGDWKAKVFIFMAGTPTDVWRGAAADLKSLHISEIIVIACCETADLTVLRSITGTVLEMKNMSSSDYSAFFRFNDSGPLPLSETISIGAPPGHVSIDPNSPGKPSPLFGGNSLVGKPLDPRNRMETDHVKAKGDHDKAPQTSQLSKLFTDSRD